MPSDYASKNIAIGYERYQEYRNAPQEAAKKYFHSLFQSFVAAHVDEFGWNKSTYNLQNTRIEVQAQDIQAIPRRVIIVVFETKKLANDEADGGEESEEESEIGSPGREIGTFKIVLDVGEELDYSRHFEKPLLGILRGHFAMHM